MQHQLGNNNTPTPPPIEVSENMHVTKLSRYFSQLNYIILRQEQLS